MKTEIEKMERDILILVLRLMAEPIDSFAPETAEVMERWMDKAREILGGKEGDMLKRLKEIEKELMAIYAEAKKVMPALVHLSFEISTSYSGETRLSGFYFIGEECNAYSRITKLEEIVTKAKERRAKNEILYQSFEGGV